MSHFKEYFLFSFLIFWRCKITRYTSLFFVQGEFQSQAGNDVRGIGATRKLAVVALITSKIWYFIDTFLGHHVGVTKSLSLPGQVPISTQYPA